MFHRSQGPLKLPALLSEPGRVITEGAFVAVLVVEGKGPQAEVGPDLEKLVASGGVHEASQPRRLMLPEPLTLLGRVVEFEAIIVVPRGLLKWAVGGVLHVHTRVFQVRKWHRKRRRDNDRF